MEKSIKKQRTTGFVSLMFKTHEVHEDCSASTLRELSPPDAHGYHTDTCSQWKASPGNLFVDGFGLPQGCPFRGPVVGS